MTKNEVKNICANFEVLTDTNVVYQLDGDTKYFGTNKQSASKILYMEKFTSQTHFFGESLTIYFDTNDVIIAYYYNPPG